ncbi:hypothetical protein BOW53_08245 [Solemya pervernicosa gill symbiont]|uniref:DNA-binding protein n=1 Tax=Solemya pervernicosa gill symbiont TaxID=642797 RepID=A0A1T2L592_9GAMM|nr:hypothetical protein [Solemya pervernicosa gill symbiont]OOZ40288.1 hypothetical protein BOW53_08245 [Solemya pervernicosa gill symbiont]
MTAYVTKVLEDAYAGKMSSLREIQFRTTGLTNEQAADFCFVTPRTWRRWRAEMNPNPLALRLLSILGGYVPWTGWERWEVRNGYMFPPGYEKHGVLPGHILAIPFAQQLITSYQRQLEEQGEDSPDLAKIVLFKSVI